MPTQKLLYTVPEVMERLQLTRWAVYELINRRELPSVTIGRSRRVSRRALVEYLARREEDAAS